ncbi:MAG: type II toxin-antitoxin system YafQ family toxin [Clostridiales bacterium]|nr:type II toxin-antitoxin system YafQ family toxin [Candidatus Coliplasma equi]
MKYEVKPSNQFKKDLKLAAKRGYKIELLTEIIKKLANGEVLEPKYKDHQLSGNFGFYRECHIQPDWLLIYQIDGEQLILLLSRTGTHSDLF